MTHQALARVMVALAAILALTESGLAKQPTSEPMTFTFWRADFRPRFNLIQNIYAEGVIEAGTTSKFLAFVKEHHVQAGATVFFNSPGGNLVQGVVLGEAIRRLKFDTDVGHRGPPRPESNEKILEAISGATSPMPLLEQGVCMSSCSLAFLGGVHRYVEAKSIFGVHRFSSGGSQATLDDAQIVSGALVEYIARMGVDARLFELMTEVGPSAIRILTSEELAGMRVTTPAKEKEEWRLKAIPGGIYLVGTLVDIRGTSKLIFFCERPKNVLWSLVIVPAGNDQSANLMMSDRAGAGYFVDGDIRAVSEAPSQFKIERKNLEISITWLVHPADIQAIVSAKENTGFAILSKMNGIFYGLEIGFGSNGEGRSMIGNYANNCWRG